MPEIIDCVEAKRHFWGKARDSISSMREFRDEAIKVIVKVETLLENFDRNIDKFIQNWNIEEDISFLILRQLLSTLITNNMVEASRIGQKITEYTKR